MSISTWFTTHILPIFQFLEKEGATAAIAIAHDVISAAEAGASFPSLIALVVTEGKAKGIVILEQTALVALNTAENQLIVAGTPAPITVAAVAAATPSPVADNATVPA